MKARVIFGGLLTVFIAMSSVLSVPAAKATPLAPDWFSGDPIVIKSDREYSTERCTHQMRQINTNKLFYYKEEDKHAKDWCVYRYKDYDIVFYQRWFSSVVVDVSDPFGLYPRQESGMAISFDGGPLTPVDNIDYGLMYRLVYVPNSDKPLFSVDCEYIGCTVSLYDFKSHITQNITSLSGTYTYNASLEEEWSLAYKDGVNVRVQSIGVSDNGEWISFIVPNIGLARMNTKVLDWEIVDTGTDYELGRVPYTSITDNGGTIWRVGSSGRASIVQYSQGCSTLVPSRLDENGGYRSNIATTCAKRILGDLLLNTVQPLPGYSMPVSYFSVAGSGSRAILQLNSSHLQWYNIYPSHAPIDNGMTYLALGDSYSSGEGDMVKDGISHYLPSTNMLGDYTAGIPRELCHTSDRSYPFLLAKDMGLTRGSDMQSIACSGAVRNDIYSSNASSAYNGQPVLQFDGDTRPRLEGLVNISSLQDDAIQNFIPGRVRQVELLKKYKPQVATVGVSGNDLGFAAILTECMTNMPNQTCNYADGEGLTSLGAAIKANYQSQVDLYKALKQASPGTDLYAIGYPQFIYNEKAFCWEIGNGLTATERTMLVQAVAYTNQTIKNAAATAGIKYIDIENALARDGGDMCEQSTMVTDPAEKVFSGFITSAINRNEDGYANTDGFPISLGVDQVLSDIRRNADEGVYVNAIALMMQEAFHPNARAHYAMYNYVHSYQSGTSLLDDKCDGMVIICSLDVNKKMPAVPEYFGVTDVHTEFMNMVRVDDGTGQRYILQTGLTTVEQGHLLQLIADESINNPGSMADVVIRSEPRTIGNVQVGAGGAFNAFVRIPEDTPIGYHVISVEGLDGSGGRVKYVQTIFVTGPRGDFDGDGIANTADTCEFLTPSGIDTDNDGIDDSCDLHVIKKGVQSQSNRVSTPGTAGIAVSSSSSIWGEIADDDHVKDLGVSRVLALGDRSSSPIQEGEPEPPSILLIVTIVALSAIGIFLFRIVHQIKTRRNKSNRSASSL